VVVVEFRNVLQTRMFMFFLGFTATERLLPWWFE